MKRAFLLLPDLDDIKLQTSYALEIFFQFFQRIMILKLFIRTFFVII